MRKRHTHRTDRRPQPAEDCRCGTGHYCHRHQGYSLDAVLSEADNGILRRGYQKCGGGFRRVLKKIGAN